MYLNGMGSIRKRIKIPIFTKKKKFSSYHGNFVNNKNLKIEKWKNEINKNENVFFLKANDVIYVYIMFNLGNSCLLF